MSESRLQRYSLSPPFPNILTIHRSRHHAIISLPQPQCPRIVICLPIILRYKNIRNPICFSPKDCLIAPFPSTYMIQREKFLDCPHNSSDSVVEGIKSSIEEKAHALYGKKRLKKWSAIETINDKLGLQRSCICCVSRKKWIVPFSFVLYPK